MTANVNDKHDALSSLHPCGTVTGSASPLRVEYFHLLVVDQHCKSYKSKGFRNVLSECPDDIPYMLCVSVLLTMV